MTTPVRHVSDIYKNQYNNKQPSSHPTFEDGREKNHRITSNLLRPKLNGPLKSNLLGSKKQDSSYNKRAKTCITIPSARSSRSQDSSRGGVNTPVRTPRLKKGTPLVDSNSLIRGLYRVRSSSTRSLDLKSEGDLSREDNNESQNPSLQHDLCEKQASIRGLKGYDKENNERESLSKNKLNSLPFASAGKGQNRSHNYTDVPLSCTSIQIESQNEHPTTPPKALDQRNKNGPNFSFTQTSYFNSSTKKSRHLIDKFNKEWENQKQQIERGGSKQKSFIQFLPSGNPLIPRSKVVAFERTGRKGLYSDLAKTPGPADYNTNIPSRNTGFSFGKNKKIDLTCLPVIEDVNKMLDPVRHINLA